MGYQKSDSQKHLNDNQESLPQDLVDYYLQDKFQITLNNQN